MTFLYILVAYFFMVFCVATAFLSLLGIFAKAYQSKEGKTLVARFLYSIGALGLASVIWGAATHVATMAH